MEYQDELERMRDRKIRKDAKPQRHTSAKSQNVQQEQRRAAISRKKRKRNLLMAGILAAAALIGMGFYYVKYKVMEGYWTIAVYGVDSRDGKLGKGSLSDVEMIGVIDRKTGEIKLVSVYRDTYMEIDSDGNYNKINQAYFRGGPDQATTALERNLDLKIDDYATFNWKAVAEAINILGGIELEISDSEFKYINGFITETVNSTGIGSVHLEHPGMNRLDGVQAVSYARLRLMDTDYNRTARQRKVISLAMEKAKQADFSVLNNILVTVLPQISTSIGIDDLIPLAKNAKKYSIGASDGFPFSRGEAFIGKKDAVIPLTLESNVTQLHSFLYGTENYQPSARVKKISAKIADDSGMGEVAENAPKAHTGGGSSKGTETKATVPHVEEASSVAESTVEETSEAETESSEKVETEADPVQESLDEKTGPGINMKETTAQFEKPTPPANENQNTPPMPPQPETPVKPQAPAEVTQVPPEAPSIPAESSESPGPIGPGVN